MKDPLRGGGIIVLLGLMLIFTAGRLVSPARAEASHFVYLPAVFSPGLSLPNGDFESGDANWVLNPTNEQLLFTQDELPPSYLAHSGTHVAWLGDHLIYNQAADQSISQPVDVPSSNPVLNFWQMSHSEEHCATSQDKFLILIDGQPVYMIILCNEQNTYSWHQEFVKLTRYAGKTVYLTIQVITNAGSPSEVYLDDFSFAPQ